MHVASADGAGNFVVSVHANGFTRRAATATILIGHFDPGPTTDIALVERSTNRNGVAFALGQAGGQFTLREDLESDFASWAGAVGVVPHVGDFDGNGLSDIALIQSYRGVDWTTGPVAYTHSNKLAGGKSQLRQTFQNHPAPGFVGWAKGPKVRVLVDRFGE